MLPAPVQWNSRQVPTLFEHRNVIRCSTGYIRFSCEHIMRIFYLIMLRVYARKVTLGSQDAEARVP